MSLKLLVLKTQQPDALRSFYQTLGIELAHEQHGKGPVHFSGHLGDVVLELYPFSEDAAADTTTRLGFAVDELETVVQSLEATGTSIISKPQATEWGVRAVVRDPDGRAVELYQR